MTTPLLRHQRLALAWMSRRESGCAQPIGGILADDQGLGKTVTTIALIASNPRHGQQLVPLPALKRGGGAKAGSDSAAGAGDDGAGPSKPKGAKAPAAGARAAGAGASGSDEEEDEEETEEEEEEVIELDLTAAERGRAAPARPALAEGATLVVCPTTVLHQWEQEIRSKTNPSAHINVYVYHGKGECAQRRQRRTSGARRAESQHHTGTVLLCAFSPPARPPLHARPAAGKGVSPQSLARFAVVLTTFATMTQEMPDARRPLKKQALDGGGPGAGQKRKADSLGDKGGPLFRTMWHRVVLDEAQVVKNSRTLAAHAAWALKARRRWCLSGTPLQNSVEDLYSYFRFLRYEPYSRHATFKALIRDPIAAASEVGFKRLHAVLHTILLRRTKTSKIDGEPVIKLPDRILRLVQHDFATPEERDFYAKLSKEAAERMRDMQADGSLRQNYVNMLWMLLRLRQACNHPWLVRGTHHVYRRATPEAAAEAAAARRLPAEARAQLAETLRERLTVCVDCGDIPEDPVVSVCDHIYCRQCVSGRVSMAGQGAAEAELAFHCESPACGRVLGRHDTFSAEALDPEAAAAAAAAAATADGAPALSSGGPAGRGEWQSSTKVDALMEVLRDLRRAGAAQAGDAGPAPAPAVRSVSQSRLAEALSRGKGRAGSPATPAARPPMEKVIVFSQWTSMLDLVEAPLKKEKWVPAAGAHAFPQPCAKPARAAWALCPALPLTPSPSLRACCRFQFRRLDGTMTVASRQAAIRDFSTRPEVTVMLVSLKAASLGVNLVSANHVVLLDLWYNPSQEDQAIDRAHRIGQTRPVHVTRITIKNSIEDKILDLQRKKNSMVASAFGEDGAAGGGLGARLTLEDLTFLFQGA
jgi:SNF2 family DNA or RNA helicase